eukprot:10512380-Ditylum_brightwellii.AAC.1
MHVAIKSQVKICYMCEDVFKLLEKLYAALYTSQDNMNKTWIKNKKRKNLDIDDMRWDFQVAKQYMHDNNLQYIETDKSKQHDCVKNLIVNGKHQYIRCFNTFLKKQTGFSFNTLLTGSGLNWSMET